MCPAPFTLKILSGKLWWVLFGRIPLLRHRPRACARPRAWWGAWEASLDARVTASLAPRLSGWDCNGWTISPLLGKFFLGLLTIRCPAIELMGKDQLWGERAGVRGKSASVQAAAQKLGC